MVYLSFFRAIYKTLIKNSYNGGPLCSLTVNCGISDFFGYLVTSNASTFAFTSHEFLLDSGSLTPVTTSSPTPALYAEMGATGPESYSGDQYQELGQATVSDTPVPGALKVADLPAGVTTVDQAALAMDFLGFDWVQEIDAVPNGSRHSATGADPLQLPITDPIRKVCDPNCQG
jgi:hypothetical protein